MVKSSNKPSNKSKPPIDPVYSDEITAHETLVNKSEVNKIPEELELTENDVTSKRIIISALIILFIMGVIGFLTFGISQSNKANNVNLASSPASYSTSITNISASTGKIDDVAASISTTIPTSLPTVKNDAPISAITPYRASNTKIRFGNNYKLGDIKSTTYITIKGDTLWQIAQGRYGSGYAWVKIAQINNLTRPLPNGTPLNLPIGFKLILPNLP